ncbi:MAG: hypothetical protein KF729_05935 [Sandaracinaceae bacterium]|nr:hypothetical protein [Sandaracinaceae bacterium]
MSDPFDDALRAHEPGTGPFRTGEPTREERLARAREGSFERVRDATAAAIAEERARARRTRGYLVLLFALSVLGLAAVVAMTVANVRGAGALFCPALAAVLVLALLAWKQGALERATREPSVPDEP